MGNGENGRGREKETCSGRRVFIRGDINAPFYGITSHFIFGIQVYISGVNKYPFQIFLGKNRRGDELNSPYLMSQHNLKTKKETQGRGAPQPPLAPSAHTGKKRTRKKVRKAKA
jgi:hypothetical protein